MGNVIMKAQQIAYGASNVEKALDDLNVPELIELNKRMDAIDAWKANVHEETYTGSELTIKNALALPARSLITEINAIQDLHGYDHPWAGGAGKNLFGGTVGTIFDLPKTIPANTQIAISFTRTASDQGNAVTLNLYKSGESTRYDYYTISDSSRVVIVTEDTARVLVYGTDIDITNIQIEIGSTATSYAPYSNICPISGRTQVVVNVSGHNMWDEQWEVGGINSTTGQPETASDRIRSKNYIPISGNTDYFAKISGNNVALYIYYYDENYNHITSSSLSHTTFDYKSNQTTHSPANARYMKFNTNGAYGNAYHNNIGINYPNSLTDYVPYVSNKNYIILLSQTTYGDSVAIVKDGSGWKKVETIGHGLQTLTRNLTWRKGANPNTPAGRYMYYFTEGLTGCKPAGGDDNRNNLYMKSNVYDISNTSYSTVAYRAYFSLGIGGDNNIATIGINTAFSDGADFLTWLDNNPVQIWYPLATPQVIETAITVDDVIQMLKGYNRVSIEDGSIELKALVLGGDY